MNTVSEMFSNKPYLLTQLQGREIILVLRTTTPLELLTLASRGVMVPTSSRVHWVTRAHMFGEGAEMAHDGWRGTGGVENACLPIHIDHHVVRTKTLVGSCSGLDAVV